VQIKILVALYNSVPLIMCILSFQEIYLMAHIVSNHKSGSIRSKFNCITGRESCTIIPVYHQTSMLILRNSFIAMLFLLVPVSELADGYHLSFLISGRFKATEESLRNTLRIQALYLKISPCHAYNFRWNSCYSRITDRSTLLTSLVMWSRI
jgi:hypothetical protein